MKETRGQMRGLTQLGLASLCVVAAVQASFYMAGIVRPKDKYEGPVTVNTGGEQAASQAAV